MDDSLEEKFYLSTDAEALHTLYCEGMDRGYENPLDYVYGRSSSQPESAVELTLVPPLELGQLSTTDSVVLEVA